MASAWIEKSPGYFERPASAYTEMIVAKLLEDNLKHGRDVTSVGAWSSFTFTPSSATQDVPLVSLLKQAWKQLLIERPSIAVVISTDGIARFKAPQNAQDLEDWCAKTFHIIEDPAKTENDVFFESKGDPLVQIYYFPHAPVPKLLFYSTHWRLDGVGTAQLCGVYYRILANTIPSDSQNALKIDKETLFRSLSDLAKIPDDPSDEVKAHIASDLAVSEGIDAMLGLPYNTSATTPTNTRHVERVYTRESTSALIAASKKLGVTVTSALTSAMIKAMGKLATEERRHLPYLANTTANARRFLPPPHNADDVAAGNYFMSFTITGYAATPFVTLAKQIGERTRAQINGLHLAGANAYMLSRIQRIVAQAEPAPGFAPSGCTFSSVGLADRYCPSQVEGPAGRIDVRHLGLRPHWVIPAETMLGALTLGGRLGVNAGYNPPFRSREQTNEFLDAIEAELDAGCGVRLLVDSVI